MKISSNAAELVKYVQDLKEEIDRKLRYTVCKFSANMVGIAAKNTPLGDSDLNDDLYLRRYRELGLSPIEGLARGGWQAGTSQSSYFREVYGSNSDQIAVSDAFENMYTQYNLGEDIYVSNTGPYILALQANYSDQTQGAGIGQPTQDQIVAIFRQDFQSIYERA